MASLYEAFFVSHVFDFIKKILPRVGFFVFCLFTVI
jgi:hypothetical protein